MNASFKSKRISSFPRNTIVLFLLTGCLVFIGHCASDEDIAAEDDTVDQVASLVNELAPIRSRSKRVPVTEMTESIEAVGDRINVRLPLENHGKVSLRNMRRDSLPSLNVELPPSLGDLDATVASDGTIVYQGFESTDIAIQTYNNGVRIQTISRDETSPTEFIYSVDVPKGGKIELLKNGAVAILNHQGVPIGGFDIPWAVDADKKNVATHYEIRDTSVVQIVEHRTENVRYPVIADPYLGIDLIDSATWDTRPEGRRLMVIPTAWARACAGGYNVGVYGWEELTDKYVVPNNVNSMRNQYICHQQFAFFKSSWNLDEWRPDVGYIATVQSGCNP